MSQAQRTGMSWESWVYFVFGLIAIGIGLAYFFSARFASFALTKTGQGRFWTKLLGERAAPIVAKFVFSAVSIAFGAWLIYNAYVGGHPY